MVVCVCECVPNEKFFLIFAYFVNHQQVSCSECFCLIDMLVTIYPVFPSLIPNMHPSGGKFVPLYVIVWVYVFLFSFTGSLAIDH